MARSPLIFLTRRGRRRSSLSRYLGAGEEPVLITRQHPFALVGAAVRVFGLLAPLILMAWGVAGVELLRGEPGMWILRVLFLGMFVLVARLGWAVLEWEFERVVITGEKVIHIDGVLQRRIASTPLAKVSEFTVRQPLVGRIFDFGMLVVDVPGGRDQALHGMSFLPDPAGMYRLVSDLGRRGRVEEGGGDLTDVVDEVGALVRVPIPSAEELTRIDWDATDDRLDAAFAGRPDPWEPTLDGDQADHTITIPRISPRA